ncbi:MAG: amidase domain-containing protein, partial [Thermoplasmata archaeon]
ADKLRMKIDEFFKDNPAQKIAKAIADGLKKWLQDVLNLNEQSDGGFWGSIVNFFKSIANRILSFITNTIEKTLALALEKLLPYKLLYDLIMWVINGTEQLAKMAVDNILKANDVANYKYILRLIPAQVAAGSVAGASENFYQLWSGNYTSAFTNRTIRREKIEVETSLSNIQIQMTYEGYHDTNAREHFHKLVQLLGLDDVTTGARELPEGDGDGKVQSYDRAAAVAYAQQYWNTNCDCGNNYNPWGGDCCHFASHCLKAGGVVTSGGGGDGGLIIYCPQMYTWFTANAGVRVNDISQLEPGDIILYDWNDANDRWQHAAVYIGNGKVAAHNSNHWNVDWRLGGAKEYALLHVVVDGESNGTGGGSGGSGGDGEVIYEGEGPDYQGTNQQVNVTEGVHPYKTVFNITIKGELRVDATVFSKVIITEGGHANTVAKASLNDKVICIDLNIRLEFYSGWHLLKNGAALKYEPSNTLLGDLSLLFFEIMKAAWDNITKVLAPVIDMVMKFVSWIGDLIGKFLDKIMPIIENISRVILMIMEAIQNAARIIVGVTNSALITLILEAIEEGIKFVDSIIPDSIISPAELFKNTFAFQIFGFKFNLTWDFSQIPPATPKHNRSVEIEMELSLFGFYHAKANFTMRDNVNHEANGAEPGTVYEYICRYYPALAMGYANVSFWNFTLNWTFDPCLVTQDSFLKGIGQWWNRPGHGFEIEIVVGQIKGGFDLDMENYEDHKKYDANKKPEPIEQEYKNNLSTEFGKSGFKAEYELSLENIPLIGNYLIIPTGAECIDLSLRVNLGLSFEAGVSVNTDLKSLYDTLNGSLQLVRGLLTNGNITNLSRVIEAGKAFFQL